MVGAEIVLSVLAISTNTLQMSTYQKCKILVHIIMYIHFTMSNPKVGNSSAGSLQHKEAVAIDVWPLLGW